MKSLLFMLLIGCCGVAVASDPVIDPRDAAKFIGKTVVVKGFCAQVVAHEGDVFINFGSAYPTQSFFAIVPNVAVEKIGLPILKTFEGKVCSVTGRIDLYRREPKIEINELSQIRD